MSLPEPPQTTTTTTWTRMMRHTEARAQESHSTRHSIRLPLPTCPRSLTALTALTILTILPTILVTPLEIITPRFLILTREDLTTPGHLVPFIGRRPRSARPVSTLSSVHAMARLIPVFTLEDLKATGVTLMTCTTKAPTICTTDQRLDLTGPTMTRNTLLTSLTCLETHTCLAVQECLYPLLMKELTEVISSKSSVSGSSGRPKNRPKSPNTSHSLRKNLLHK